MNPAPAVWGDAPVAGEVDGCHCRVFEPRCRSLGELIEQGRRWSDRDFLVQGERRMTFDAVLGAVAATRDRLAGLGVGRGDRVMILAANSPEWAVAFLAVTTSGAAAVLGNGWWLEPDIAPAVALTEPRLVIADARRAERIGTLAPVVDLGDLTGGPPAPDAAVSGPAAPVDVDEADPAYLLFTSGTTSRPKAAVLTHRSAVANIHGILAMGRQLPHQVDGSRPQKVSLCALPLFHISGVQTLLQALVVGNRLVFLPGRFDAGEVLALIERERITHWAAVPAMGAMILEHPDLTKWDLSSLEFMFMGGAPVPPELVERVRAALPSVRQTLGKGYGSTEAGGTVSMGGGAALAARPARSGLPLPLTEVRIAGPDEGGHGEILVRSPAVMSGYVGVPAAEQPVDAEGWLHTGDIGHLDEDGYLHVTDRIKDIIIRGGENIASTAVEACLLEHPAVAQAAVVGLDHPVWGEEVGAAVVLRTGAAVDATELAAFAAGRLPGFAVPTRWWFPAAPFPLTDSGKVMKRDLKAAWPHPTG